MTRKTSLGLKLDKEEELKLDQISKETGMSRSEIVDTAMGKCVENPGLIGAIVTAMLSQPLPGKRCKKAPTSVTVTPNYIDQLDELAGKLVLSRNTLINIIVGGVNLRLI